MDNQNKPTAFDEMPLSAEVLKAIDEIGYLKPTNIQAGAIPLLLEGHDLIGRSCTGSGKTMAFGVPAIERVDATSDRAQVLVLAPTRELAMQIYDEMKKVAKYKQGVVLAVVYGGASMTEQIKQLRRANVVIGTPGRLMDHMRRKTLKPDGIRSVVLDEADEMLNMGFIEDIETILTQLPEDRQTILFSATMSPALLKISNTFLVEPETVDVMSGEENQADIEQTYFQISQGSKKDVLTLLMHANGQRSIIFCNTKLMVDELADLLGKQGFKAAGLHGDMSQEARSKVMKGFRNGDIHALVATDVAARGIDVDDVAVVINYDLPQSFEYYVHRIGRTGRAGNRGVSQTLICTGKQYDTLRSLMKFTGVPIQERKLPASEEIMEKAVQRTALKAQRHAKARPGKTAHKLVEHLLKDDTFDGSVEQVAVVLAEMIMGGDEQFERLRGIAEFKRTPGRKNSSRNSGGHAGRKHKPKHAGQSGQKGSGNRSGLEKQGGQGKRKSSGGNDAKDPRQNKRQRSRAGRA